MTNTKVLFVCATQGKRVSRVLKLIEVLSEMNCAVSFVTPGPKTIYSKGFFCNKTKQGYKLTNYD